MASRNLANEINQGTVDTLLSATESGHDIVHRYYGFKAHLLGLEKLYDYDRYAPIFQNQPAYDWTRCREIVSGAYAQFDPKAGGIVREFFDKSWIDAEPRLGKRGGAFSSSTVPSVHPYIMVNYTDRTRDVMTVAHELGHGIHQYLSRPVGYLQCHAPLTLAETASVFGEMLVFHRLMEIETDPKVRLGLLCSKLEDAFATTFRQIVLTRFEQKLHDARREEGELKAERIGELWMEVNRPMHGDTVELTEDYTHWWMYIPHFIHTPFYCYAYAFGELLVLALYQQYREQGRDFIPRYFELLSAGGSESPEVLLAKLGVDITDPGFYQGGLQILRDMLDEVEDLAK
jgi:oligoendopeptidase F